MANKSAEFNPRSMSPPALGNVVPSPSHEKSRELRLLERQFPGLEADERVITVFSSPNSGKVVVFNVLKNQLDSQSYLLGGEVDYQIEAVPALQPTRSSLWEAGEITLISGNQG